MKADTPFLWQLIPAVRRRERRRFAFFAGLYALINVGQTVGLVGSEALFLAHLGPERLPGAFVLASATTVTVCFCYAAVVGRHRNDRLYVWMLSGFGFLLALATGLLPWAPGSILVALFCAFYVSQAVFVHLHYWTFATDYFDTLSSKRLFPFLVAAGSAGAAAGGLLAVVLSRGTKVDYLILAWAAILVAAAFTVRGARRSLRRWLPVGTVEADESSVAGMRGAFEFVRRSQLARWLVLSVVGMVLALFLVQYLYLKVFASTFGSARALAGFFGIYLALTNGVEIAVSNVLTPQLIRRFGVARASLVHPVATLLSFVALGFDPALHTAVLARANRELLENALAAPVRTLSYNALPFRFRGRIRALLEGIVFYAAMSLAGLSLLALGNQLSFRWLCLLGFAAAGVYATANLRVRREYTRALVGELRNGRLDIQELGGELADDLLSSLSEQWEDWLRQEKAHPSRAVVELTPVLVRRGFPGAVRKAARHPDAKVRCLSLDALAAASDEGLARLLPDALADDDPGVRLAAARACAAVTPWSDALRQGLLRALSDSDYRVRAQAASRLGEEGYSTLRAMLASPESAAVSEALRQLPRQLLDEARRSLDDARAGVRAAAMACMVRLSDSSSLTEVRLDEELRHPDDRVRREAVLALRARGGLASATKLAKALDDPSRVVRIEASQGLASLGEVGISAAESALMSQRTWTVDAALNVLALAGDGRGRVLLEATFRRQVRAAWWNRAARARVRSDGSLANRFLCTALEDACARSIWLAFRSLELLEDPAVVRSVQKSLDTDSPRARSDALEVLSNLGERKSTTLLSLLLEEGALEEKLPFVANRLRLPQSLDEVLCEAGASDDPWLRLAAPSAARLNDDEERIMEGLLALRNVPLFAHLSLHQLEAINRFVSEVQYLGGEVVVREGDPGDELYVLLGGEVQAFKRHGTSQQVLLSTLSPISYFGEMAILDSAPRSATVVVTQDARLLRLAGARFKELILQTPEIAFEIFPVLTERIRTAERRLEA